MGPQMNHSARLASGAAALKRDAIDDGILAQEQVRDKRLGSFLMTVAKAAADRSRCLSHVSRDSPASPHPHLSSACPLQARQKPPCSTRIDTFDVAASQGNLRKRSPHISTPQLFWSSQGLFGELILGRGPGRNAQGTWLRHALPSFERLKFVSEHDSSFSHTLSKAVGLWIGDCLEVLIQARP